MKKVLFISFLILFLFSANHILAHQPNIIFSKPGDINIIDAEISRAFFDDLRGQTRNYLIESDKDFQLYINLLVPDPENRGSKYSADVFDESGQKIYSLDGESFIWKSYYEEYGRDYYLKGPELEQKVSAGKYKIEVYSKDNIGKYVLAVGKTEYFNAGSLLNIYWQLPLLKIIFFKTSVLQFFLTPFGIVGIGIIGAIFILIALINYIIGVVQTKIKQNEAKTLLLTSGGMPQMYDEIIKLLQKPAYDVTVAFVNTAHKYMLEGGIDDKDIDLQIMRDLGFNVQEVDIEGMNKNQIMDIFQLKDIIFVDGGNTFYLLNAMRKCGFEGVIRKLLKQGKVYVGVSAGSIVAGKTIKPAVWLGDKNIGLKKLKGLGLVSFDIFVHYTPEWMDIIKKQIPDEKKRIKSLKILTDDQAILVQGKEAHLIGDGDAVIV